MEAIIPAETLHDAAPVDPRPLIYRTRLPVRIWHWVNALSIFVMLMSGATIFNAPPPFVLGSFWCEFR